MANNDEILLIKNYIDKYYECQQLIKGHFNRMKSMKDDIIEEKKDPANAGPVKLMEGRVAELITVTLALRIP